MGPQELVLFQNDSEPELSQTMAARYQVPATSLEWAMQDSGRPPGWTAVVKVVRAVVPPHHQAEMAEMLEFAS